MPKDLYSQLLSEFGKLLGLEKLSPNNEGHCLLVFDETIQVHMQYSKDSDELTLFSRLGQYDSAEKSEPLLERLLVANLFWQYTGGATLSVDPKKKAIFLAKRLELSGLGLPQFEQLLENFVNAAEYIIQEVLPGKALLPEVTEQMENLYSSGIRP